MGLLGGGIGKLAGGLGKGLGKNLGKGLGKNLGKGLGKNLGGGKLLQNLGKGGGLGQGKLAEAFQGVGGKLGEAFQQMGGVQGIMDMINQFAGMGGGGEGGGGGGEAQAAGGGGGDNPIARMIQALMQGGDPGAIDQAAQQIKDKLPDPQMGQLVDLFANLGKQAMQAGRG